jgi:hypothetical protein
MSGVVGIKHTGIETSSAEQAHLQQVHPHCIMWVISLLPHIGTPFHMG